MRTFFRYWSWGMVGAICLAVGLSLFVRYSEEQVGPAKEVMLQDENAWVSFVVDLNRKWKVGRIDQKQGVLFIEFKEVATEWEELAQDVITESFIKLKQVEVLRLRLVNKEPESARVICIKRSDWQERVKKSKWSTESIQDFNLSNDKKQQIDCAGFHESMVY
ncbi:hypothetical protein [Thermoactinomyces sp. DSM 45892]|uniref:hypothetical protein n=1 Tax=Thermoactinomyces sp. DSM 45892 TaxID=1882753 RepID=UPI0008963037|nr:hypothetical protein [Thermoactinomyces sp. DSM 45892]SDZ10682.1 hypothetical protein SAMN05444416_113114 [Thermoactinomyces sp. DSM 45892]